MILSSLDEQRRIILELLRTRNLGGGQQGVMEWSNRRAGSEIPLSGDIFKQAFGEGREDDTFMPTAEAYSRDKIEWAMSELAKYDPRVYLTMNSVFSSDVGGYRDYEFYSRDPRVQEDVERGLWLMVAMLPPGEVRLHVDPGGEPMTEEEREVQRKSNAGVYTMWERGREAGVPKHVVMQEICDTYGISEKVAEQIVEQEIPLERQL